jgi:hypothetical protein
MKRARAACSFAAAASFVALAACDSIYSTAPGATSGEAGASGADSSATTSADGATSEPATDGASSTLDGAMNGAGSDGAVADAAVPLGNVDCSKLLNVLFCADFEGSFPYGFSTAANSATITQTKGMPNGQSSYVLDMQLADGADAGGVVTELFQPIKRPATGSIRLDADVRVIALGCSYASLAGFTNVSAAFAASPGVGVAATPTMTARFVGIGDTNKTIASADSNWHHLFVVVDAAGTFTVGVDTMAAQSTSNSAPPDTVDLAVGLFDVPAGAGSGATDVQIDNVVVRAF